ncbi:MAG TPA: carboxynorspermidine decarboxylase [Desulfuromonadaceae bacterium]
MAGTLKSKSKAKVSHLIGIDIDKILELAPSPAYVVDLGRLRHNLAILDHVQELSGAKILLALKAFSMWSTFPIIRETLHGVCASSPWEARLGYEEFGREVHSFSAAFKECDIKELLQTSNHLVFNSFNQLERFRPLWEKERSHVSIGLRVNPEHTEGHTAIYDPCAPKSRLGIPLVEFEGKSLVGVEGLHFHTLCEHLFEPLERTARVFEEKFGHLLPQMKWLNLGGGHHITREGYDIDGLVRLIKYFKDKYAVEVYIEPGEAIAIGTGILVSEVLDVVHNQMDIAILDVSATCHMPDILEMPYRPGIEEGYDPGEKAHTYRLGGPSCLAGDVIGDWSFETPLQPGRRLAFLDMAHYTMVKTTTFNGIQHPAICTYEPKTGQLKVVRGFEYQDFKGRLS